VVLGSIASLALAVACSKSEPPAPSETPVTDASAPPVVDAATPVPVDADPTPYEIPSRQRVRFRLAEGDGGKRSRVILPGFVIERVDDAGAATRLDLDAPPDCPCAKCPPPPATGADLGAPEVTWDARAFAIWRYMEACDGGGTGKGAKSAAQPAAPGRYKVKLLVAICDAKSPAKDGKCKGTGARPDEEEFDLPASGDVVVEIK